MLKKFNFTSPIGIALTAAGILLALSPGARKTVRNIMVKGTAGVMDAIEQVSGAGAGMLNPKTFTWKSNESNETNQAPLVPELTPVVKETDAITEQAVSKNP